MRQAQPRGMNLSRRHALGFAGALALPRIAMAQAVDDVMVRDRLIRSFPEVEQAVGKVGRADTATDPSPRYDSRDPETGLPSVEKEITMSRE